MNGQREQLPDDSVFRQTVWLLLEVKRKTRVKSQTVLKTKGLAEFKKNLNELFNLFYSVGSTVSKKGIAAFIFQKSDSRYHKNQNILKNFSSRRLPKSIRRIL